jgi:hypothetical protein
MYLYIHTCTVPDEYVETDVTVVQKGNQGGGREHLGVGTYTELEKIEETLSEEYSIYDCTVPPSGPKPHSTCRKKMTQCKRTGTAL